MTKNNVDDFIKRIQRLAQGAYNNRFWGNSEAVADKLNAILDECATGLEEVEMTGYYLS
jgi:predicted transcriptional regulator